MSSRCECRARPSAALLLAAVALCSCRHQLPETSTVVFDGETHTITGHVTCTAQPDGSLVIVVSGKDRDRMRVLLAGDNRLVVEKVSLRVGESSGYARESAEMWASRVGDTYTIDGRMPPGDGEVAAHRFHIETTCMHEVPQMLPNPGIADEGP